MELPDLLKIIVQDAPLSVVLLIIGLRLIALLEKCVDRGDDKE